jgi:hypothetical protein
MIVQELLDHIAVGRCHEKFRQRMAIEATGSEGGTPG